MPRALLAASNVARLSNEISPCWLGLRSPLFLLFRPVFHVHRVRTCTRQCPGPEETGPARTGCQRGAGHLDTVLPKGVIHRNIHCTSAEDLPCARPLARCGCGCGMEAQSRARLRSQGDRWALGNWPHVGFLRRRWAPRVSRRGAGSTAGAGAARGGQVDVLPQKAGYPGSLSGMAAQPQTLTLSRGPAFILFSRLFDCITKLSSGVLVFMLFSLIV